MPRLDWLMVSPAIEPNEARTRPSAVGPAFNFEHARSLVGNNGISLSASPRVLPLGPRQTDIYLGIKTCH